MNTSHFILYQRSSHVHVWGVQVEGGIFEELHTHLHTYIQSYTYVTILRLTSIPKPSELAVNLLDLSMLLFRVQGKYMMLLVITILLRFDT